MDSAITDEYQFDKRLQVYPAYLNAKLQLVQGRKIPKEMAVDNPHVREIYEACVELKLDADIEVNHTYPSLQLFSIRTPCSLFTSQAKFSVSRINAIRVALRAILVVELE